MSGHADTAVDATANMALSQARVRAVRDFMVLLGVPRNTIIAKAYGDKRPLVPTPPDTDEAQNRFVHYTVVKTQQVPETWKGD